MRNKSKFKKVYTVKQANSDPRVNEMSAEFGNIEPNKTDWWIYLTKDYVCESMNCHTIHERSVKDCLELLNNDVIHVDEFYSKYGKR